MKTPHIIHSNSTSRVLYEFAYSRFTLPGWLYRSFGFFENLQTVYYPHSKFKPIQFAMCLCINGSL